ncbi:MAG: hypothetical protein KatS3mg011_0233 [Acidimicrobiia bacterium]|nr:MAG: hypothetical protein KatS3mg011_0233 [Acidimicrobiia bacterium]
MPSRRPPTAVIGWREWVSLPELGVSSIRAKVDTGARTAALHAFGLELTELDGTTMARFAVHPDHRRPGPAVVVEVPVVGERRVKNPGGRAELRPLIRTRLAIGPYEFETDVTLTRRDEMGFPMLLGRQTVRGRFLVDPGRSYLVGKPPEGD